MTSAPNNSYLSSDQDTNQFLVSVGIKPQISYTTIKRFISWANWNQHFYIYLIYDKLSLE